MLENTIKQILLFEQPVEKITICGWVRTVRFNPNLAFIELNDGSCLSNLQTVVESASYPGNYNEIGKIPVGSSLEITGKLVASQGKGQKWEIQAENITLLGKADETFPLQKKRHSKEFLRSIAHLRPRTNLFGAVFRVRSRLSYAIHKFFIESGYYYVHTPIITANDCEGAGEMFRITTLDPINPPLTEEGKVDYSQDFFSKETHLTVSGQLNGEIMAMGLGKVYTFGPTFRAENSNTPRHASEFWMIEPEMAFMDLQDDMTVIEDFVKFITKDLLENCAEDLEFFNQFVDKTLLERLQQLVSCDFKKITYTEAMEILKKSGKNFEFPVGFGEHLQTEHEKFLCEEHFKMPVFVTDYPRNIKAFYMKVNPDQKTVAAVDLLVPKIGELVGGSQREENLDVLLENMKIYNLSAEEYDWYLDLRRFGSVVHSGFGLGFDRMMMFVTGLDNIRDVCPFPRTPRNAIF